MARSASFALGTALATRGSRSSGSRPARVLTTIGSADNLRLLAAGAADVVFSQVDMAADQLDRLPHRMTRRSPRALARIYDDVVHVVVRAASTVRTLAGCAAARVSSAPASRACTSSPTGCWASPA